MEYSGQVSGKEAGLSVEREGLRLGSRFVDYADVAALRPVNHRVFVDTLDGESLEISMLGFSFDGFWEELTKCYGERSLEALFVEETQLMLCDGEYALPWGSGRGQIALYPDAVCVLPRTCRALRIPLCFVREIRPDGYQLYIVMRSGAVYAVGKMGYDTKPFAERATDAAALVQEQRALALRQTPARAPFTEKGLFRTGRPEQYWNAAFGSGTCAVEFFTGEDAATYLYRFSKPREVFLLQLEEAMEAVGTHREIIYRTEEQVRENPLYRMAAAQSPAVRFLRARNAGRLIHGPDHALRLQAYLEQRELP